MISMMSKLCPPNVIKIFDLEVGRSSSKTSIAENEHINLFFIAHFHIELSDESSVDNVHHGDHIYTRKLNF